jgi:hypothetical protein
MHANGCPWDWMVCANAANNGHETVLHWARSYGCPQDAPDEDGFDKGCFDEDG